MHRLAVSCFALAAMSAACLPRVANPMTSDLDGDGVFDANDRCMADPEDLDGLEDEDGCPEPGEGSVVKADGAVVAMVADPVTKQRKMQLVAAKALTRSNAKAQISPLREKAWGAAIDLDERGWLVFGFGKAWVGAGQSKGKQLRGDVYRAAFSPEGSTVALVGANALLVVDVKTGKQLKSFKFAKGTEDSPETKLMRMPRDGELIYYDGCAVFQSSLDKSATPKRLSAELCGQPLASEDGKHWYVYSQVETASSVHKLDLQGGEPILVLGGQSDQAGLSQILLSPSGNDLCYSRHKDGSDFTCRNNQRGDEVVVWEAATDTRAAFAADGKLGFGAGPLRDERDFMLADLDKLELRKLGSLGAKEKWLAPVGKQGFVASGGTQLLVFDLDKGVQISVALEKGEWEGFSAIPGRDREFILGKERTATRDLYRIRAGTDGP